MDCACAKDDLGQLLPVSSQEIYDQWGYVTSEVHLNDHYSHSYWPSHSSYQPDTNIYSRFRYSPGDLGVSENVVYPVVPNGFADHYPVFKWLFHWEYTLFSDKPKWCFAMKF